MVLNVYFIKILVVFNYFLELWYFDLLLFNFRNKYVERLSIGVKERVLEHG